MQSKNVKWALNILGFDGTKNCKKYKLIFHLSCIRIVCKFRLKWIYNIFYDVMIIYIYLRWKH
jgi:hypothetical protein